jgi:hypothetical protein
MRCPKCGTEVPVDALQCSKCKLVTPKGRTSQSLAFKKGEREGRLSKLKYYAILAGIVLIVFGIAGYVYLTLDTPSQVDPKIAIQAMTTLRGRPSTQDGVTVDEYMKRALNESERTGKLLRYRGWHIEPIAGTKDRFLVVFSFEEEGGSEQRAEWAATAANTFTAQTNLARAAYNP